MQIAIKNIIVPKGRRPLDQEKVDQIAESFDLLGQIAPIGLRRLSDATAETSFERVKKLELVFGEHRLEAAKMLGWEKIDAVEIRQRILAPCCLDGVGDYTKLVEITENLHRADLTTQQRNEQLSAWVELYNRNKPQRYRAPERPISKPGRKPDPGIEAAANMTGLTPKEVRRAIKTTEVAPAVKKAADRAELSQKQRLAVSRLAGEDKQLKAIAEFAAPDTRQPTDPAKYDDIVAQRQRLDQLLRMLGAFVALEKLGNAAQIAEAVKRLDIHDENTLLRLRRVAVVATAVANIVGGKSEPAEASS
jgi:ParB-like nuclease domain